MNWLDFLILLMSCIADLYICHIFFAAFFPRRSVFENNLYCAGMFVLFVLLQSGVNLLGSTTLNLILAPIVIFLYLALTYKTKRVRMIMYFALEMSVLLGCEFLFTVIAETTSKDSVLHLSSVPWQTFTIKLMSFMILSIIKQLCNKTEDKQTNKIFWMYLLMPVASLGMMFSTFFIGKETIGDISVKIALLCSSAFMLFANMIVFAAFDRYAKDLHLSMQQKWIISKDRMNRQYYEKIADMNENRQTMMHDLKHYIVALRAMVRCKEASDALQFLNDLNVRLDANELCVYSDIPFLDAVLSEKEDDAKERSVNMDIRVEPGCTLKGVNEMDYIVMLGNLLDNAIQAADKSKETSFVHVNIFMENDGAFLVTKISNNYNRESLVIKRNEFVSSKNDGGIHGIGIKSVKKMAAAYNGMHNVDIKEDIFTATLILPYENQ